MIKNSGIDTKEKRQIRQILITGTLSRCKEVVEALREAFKSEFELKRFEDYGLLQKYLNTCSTKEDYARGLLIELEDSYVYICDLLRCVPVSIDWGVVLENGSFIDRKTLRDWGIFLERGEIINPAQLKKIIIIKSVMNEQKKKEVKNARKR